MTQRTLAKAVLLGNELREIDRLLGLLKEDEMEDEETGDYTSLSLKLVMFVETDESEKFVDIDGWGSDVVTHLFEELLSILKRRAPEEKDRILKEIEQL